jgi:aryl-alcohol dehydrogenase-like predicted oxidoreductase
VEYRELGRSGLRISVLTMGTMTFGGKGGFAAVGTTGLDHARRQVDMCLDAGINLIDTTDVYSDGAAEEILGEVMRDRRDQALIATKVRFPMEPGPNDAGLSLHHIVKGCEAGLRRLQTDHIDLYQPHEWDGLTPPEETIEPLGLLSGKYRGDREAPAGSRQLSDWDEPSVYDRDKLYDTVDVLVSIGEAHGVSPADLTLLGPHL